MIWRCDSAAVSVWVDKIMCCWWRPEFAVQHHIDIYEVQEMEIDVYLFFMREAMIYENSQTEEGREYLKNCWRMEQTKPDREGLRRNFKKKGG